MHYSRPDFAADALYVGTQGQQSVDQRPVGMARAGMHRQARWLVDNDQVGVLVDHGNGNVLGDQPRWPRRRDRHGNQVSGVQAEGGFGCCPIDQDAAFGDQLPQPAPGEAQVRLRQELVQAAAGIDRLCRQHPDAAGTAGRGGH